MTFEHDDHRADTPTAERDRRQATWRSCGWVSDADSFRLGFSTSAGIIDLILSAQEAETVRQELAAWLVERTRRSGLPVPNVRRDAEG